MGRLRSYDDTRGECASFRARLVLPLAIIVLLAALFASMGSPRAHAVGPVPVGCSTSDLLDAVNTANTAGSGTLSLAAGCTYTLGSTTLNVSGDITIEGNGAAITGAAAGAFVVDSGATLNLDHVTISGNSVSANGGSADTGAGLPGGTAKGGGIQNDGGTVTVTNSTLSGNTAAANGGSSNSGPAAPGGIAQGGAIYTDGGTVTVTSSTLSGNSTSASGGFSNSGPGGPGGIAEGGAISNVGGTVLVTNSTLNGNSVSADGGAGSPSGPAGIANGGAVYGVTTVAANIFDGNGVATSACAGGPNIDNGYNVSDDSSCLSSPLAEGDVDTPDAAIALGPLQNNGGPTETMAIDSTSSAYGIIPAANCATTDQRGYTRLADGDPIHCDAGAYEANASAISYCTTICYVNGSTGSDTTGDGSQADPFATIQKGVDTVQDGGTVIVAAGTFSATVTVSHPVTLKGYKAGWDARYRTPSFGGETIVNPKGGPGFQVKSDNVTIDGFTFTGGVAGVAATCVACPGSISNLTVVNDIFRNNAAGLVVEDGTTVAGLTVQHDLFASNNLTAVNAPITGAGIALIGAGVDSYPDAFSTINANAFSGNATGAFVMQGVSCTSECLSPASAIGLELTNNSSNSDGSFAILDGYDNCGFYPDSCISGNTINNTTSDAILIGYNTGIDNGFSISNNTITGSRGAAIDVNGQCGEGCWVGSNVSAYGNTFSMDGYGIRVQQGGFEEIGRNIFKSDRVAAIQVESGSRDNPSADDNSIAGNAAGLINNSGNDVFADCNWWGASTGPRASANPGGYGDSVSGPVTFVPWRTSSNLSFACDTTGPIVTIFTPTNNATYKLRQSVRPVFSCSDTGGSGVASCTVTAGGSNYALDTSSTGPHTFTVTATDNAGNQTVTSMTYNVGT